MVSEADVSKPGAKEYREALEEVLDALERMYPSMHVSERVRQAHRHGREVLPKLDRYDPEDEADGPLRGPRKIA